MTVISNSDWYAAGGTRTQLARARELGRVRSLRRSRLVTGDDELGPQQRHVLKVQSVAPFLGDATVVARHSAAALHGLPVFATRLDRVTVVRTGGGHGVIAPMIHARVGLVQETDLTLVRGILSTSLARTAADLARELPFPEAVMTVDAALRLGAERDEIFDRARVGRGCRRAERAIAFGDLRAESPGESLSRAILHLAGLPAPDLQHEVYDNDHDLLGRLDFYWEGAGLGGEFDGRTKYTDLVPPGSNAGNVLWAEKRRELGVGDAVKDLTRWVWPDMWNGVMCRRVARHLGIADVRLPVLELPPGILLEGHSFESHSSRRPPSFRA